MATEKQNLGNFGELLVAAKVNCPGCNRKERTLRLLPKNFKCADLICDFCGYLAQVKTSKVKNIDALPNQILGAAWKPQMERMNQGIFFSLYIVLVDVNKNSAIYYLSKNKQTEEMFTPRKPLSENAKRKGWQGFVIDLSKAKGAVFRL